MSHWPTVFSIVNSLILTMSLKENIVQIASKYTSFIGAVGMLLHRRVWRYQRDNQNPYIEEEQRPQWPKEKVQRKKNDLQTIQIKQRRVWGYQRGNRNPYIKEEPTTQWPKKKVQNDKQRPKKHTYKVKDRVTRTPLKTGGEVRCSRRVSNSYSTSDTRHVNLTTNPVISHQWGMCCRQYFVPVLSVDLLLNQIVICGLIIS
jgi:hypothetical protein